MLINANGITHRYGDGPLVLNNAALGVEKGQIVGLLGPSGSGKSTLGQIMTGLLRPTEGTVEYRGSLMCAPFRGEARQRLQILFQHPESSFNPRLTIRASLREVYKLCKLPFSEGGLLEMLEPFGIYREHLDRFPAQLSGGELQRIALARILLPEPEFIVLDEPTSMLDVISQAQIMRMLRRLRDEKGISYLLITHDVHLCEFMSDKIYIIEDGNVLQTT